MRISDFRFRISDFKQPSVRRRRGVSILEVLFAILVTTIGLFGAIAVFPVASSMARKGRTSDMLAVAGPQAVHQFDAMELRDINRWIGWPQAWDLSTPQATTWTRATGMVLSNSQAFCIDPRIVSHPDYSASAAEADKASRFPYNTSAGKQMFRVTLDNGLGSPMGNRLAERNFVFDDDLAYGRPDDRSLEPGQLFDTIPADDGVAAGTPKRVSSRQFEGHLSWMATVCPKLERRNLLATDTFTLSIVMFYDRPLDMTLVPRPERVATIASLPGSGVTGGEVQLSVTTAQLGTATAEDYLKVRPGDWLMLKGSVTHQMASVSSVGVFQWYRVTDADPEIEDLGSGNYGRYVTLMGRDWDITASDQEAVLVDGVVGVYEKTIRLELGP